MVFPQRFRIIRISALFAVFVITAGGAFAQMPKVPGLNPKEKKAPADSPKPLSLEEQREQIKRRLTEVVAERGRESVAPLVIPRQEVEERSRLLDGLIVRLNAQLTLIDEREGLRSARAAAERRSREWSGFPEKPPYSVLMVDEVRKTMLAARARERGFEAARELFTLEVSRYRDLAKQAQARERQSADELDRAVSPEDRLVATWRKQLAGIRARNADALAAWAALRHEVLGERIGVARIELDLLQRQLAEARGRMAFTRSDLDKALARLKTSRAMLDQEMEASLARAERSAGQLAQVQREQEALTAGRGKETGSFGTGGLRDVLEARQRAAMAWVESSRFETEVVSVLIGINQAVGGLWAQRYAAASGAGSEKQRNILAEFRKNRELLRPWLEYARHQLEVHQAAEREQEARLAGMGEKSPLLPAERDLLKARTLQRRMAERLVAAAEQVDAELVSWQEDIERSLQSLSAGERIRVGAAAVSQVLRRVWNFELFAVEDTVEVAGQKIVTSHGITVGKSVGALLLFVMGFYVISFTARRMMRIMITRIGVGENQANLIRRGILGLATFILLVLTLNLARIPYTVFAFLGGALAIGVGFGTQTIIKNLISGIIILLERKVQVGDTVEVDGVVGKVTQVDIRASTVLGFDGVETMIPNSNFLENKVTSWTHTNPTLRRTVKVGVSYGSPVERVREILQECADRHGLVLKDPAPLVLFEDFGDNSLVFVLYFWVDFGPEVNPKQVASDLRFMIERCFAGENIVVAFPQREVHLDAAGILRVEMVHPVTPAMAPKEKEAGQAETS